MNVRLEHQLQFTAGTCLDGKVCMNTYYIKLEMITQTVDGVEQNIALDRIRHMLYHQFQDCIFVYEEDTEIIDKLQSTDFNVVVLPEVPVDQIVGIMLFSKLNAVMQERMYITQLKISSELGQNLWYLHSEEEELGPFGFPGWWHNIDPNTFEKNKNYSNIIKLQSSDTWHDYHLEWEDELLTPPPEDSTVLNFGKDD
jgi:hypothetical protein